MFLKIGRRVGTTITQKGNTLEEKDNERSAKK